MHELTKIIKIAALEKGIATNRELSKVLDYEETYCSSLISGRTGFPTSFLEVVADKLDRDLNDLIKVRNENSGKTK